MSPLDLCAVSTWDSTDHYWPILGNDDPVKSCSTNTIPENKKYERGGF